MSMKRSATFVLALAILAAWESDAATRRRAVRHIPATFPGASSLLWVAAHPDDETLAAPLLARVCLDERVRCSFLVLTRGEGGSCLIPTGCTPDLATVRSTEMTQAAQLFHAGLTLWNLPDGGAAFDGSTPGWDAAAGSHEALISSIAAFVAEQAPDVVLTFDPRHGSTCHADHRGAGNLMLESLQHVDRRPSVYLIETRVVLNEAPLRIAFLPAGDGSEGVCRFDANVSVTSLGTTAWEAMLSDMRIHQSQFDARWLQAIQEVEQAQRAVFFAAAEDVLGPASPIGACP